MRGFLPVFLWFSRGIVFEIELPDATHLDLINNEISKVCTDGEIERQRDEAIEIQHRTDTSPSLDFPIGLFQLFSIIRFLFS